VGKAKVGEAVALTREFLTTLFETVTASVRKGGTLKQAFADVRKAMDSKFGDYAIYEHCLPFNVSRAYDEAQGLDHPRIWTAQRDREMWAELQG
jgi:hypothetical protein